MYIVLWENVWIMSQVKDDPAIEVAHRVTYKQRSHFGFWRLIISFFLAIVQREHGAIDLGRPVLWICGFEGECISDRTNNRGELRIMCVQKVWRK